MNEKIQSVLDRYAELERLMADPAVISDPSRLQELAREHGQLGPVVETWGKLQKTRGEIEEHSRIIDSGEDPELAELAGEEIGSLREAEKQLAAQFEGLLVPPDPLDRKDIIMEIRAGTGGEEAALFAGDLFRMYIHYVESQGWKHELISISQAGQGGMKEVVFNIRGKGVYGRLKYESGVHRVQRVPATETSGRIHTSAATVAVLPEAEEVDIEIRAEELKIDVFRSSGPGGQSVNTTDSAVRITYLPTNLVVTCQDEKSQHKNKAKAMNVLRSRLLDQKIQEVESERARDRRLQIGTGDRSAKIRTYNFPQSRVTDHRIGLSLHKLEAILGGDLDDLIDALAEAGHEEKLAETHKAAK
ncbi:MAG: peptide chain release factor 1 [Candidatus Glassbacteria bacterium]|nr:peptide chain release factor 1 [Candidatus Glassbacteria bacterium]